MLRQSMLQHASAILKSVTITPNEKVTRTCTMSEVELFTCYLNPSKEDFSEIEKNHRVVFGIDTMAYAHGQVSLSLRVQLNKKFVLEEKLTAKVLIMLLRRYPYLYQVSCIYYNTAEDAIYAYDEWNVHPFEMNAMAAPNDGIHGVPMGVRTLVFIPKPEIMFLKMINLVDTTKTDPKLISNIEPHKYSFVWENDNRLISMVNIRDLYTISINMMTIHKNNEIVTDLQVTPNVIVKMIIRDQNCVFL